MEQVFLKILNMSITAGWIILAVVLLRRVLRKAPKSICFFLWLVVGVRLICPFAFESTYSLVPEIKIRSQQFQQSESLAHPIRIDAIEPTVNSNLDLASHEVQATKEKQGKNITSIVSYVWIVGLIVMLCYSHISYYRVHRRVRTAIHMKDQLWQCETVDSPFILGFFHPRIYLPFHLEESYLSHVIAHEEAHLKHFDHWIKPFAFLLLSIYWFNPLVWLAYVLLCQDIEFACDERVIKELGTNGKRSYSEALLSCSISRRTVAACPLAFGEVGVKERIKSILNYRKPTFWILSVAIVVCVAVSICFLTNPKAEEDFATTIFDQGYQVQEINYSAPQYSFTYLVSTAPRYYITSDEILMVKEDQEDWTTIGKLTKVTLTKENFEDYFKVISNIIDENMQESMKELRDENQNAWMVSVPDDSNGAFYYVLQQKNGDIYVTYGYHSDGVNPSASIKDSIRWLFHLKEDNNCIVSTLEENEEIEDIKKENVVIASTSEKSNEAEYMNDVATIIDLDSAWVRVEGSITSDDIVFRIEKQFSADSQTGIPVNELSGIHIRIIDAVR